MQPHRLDLLCWTSVAAFVLLASLPVECLAKKGGNGGGKPGGGEDPPQPTAPVSYAVTPVSMPGSSYELYGHNEHTAMVGTLYDAPPGGRRGLAYLPGVSSNAFYLDNPTFGLTIDDPTYFGLEDVNGQPFSGSGWHTQSAVDINTYGTIVGNIELDAAPDTDVRPMYITGATAGTPTLHTFATPFHPNAWHEVVTAVNDSGDMVVWSQERLPDDTSIDRLYVGNPGLHGQPAQPFIELDLASAGFVQPSISNDALKLTNRGDGASGVLVGQLYDGGESYTFRMNANGSAFEVAPDYTAEDGSHIFWDSNWGTLDINIEGDVTGGARAEPAKYGKIKNNNFAGLWRSGSDQILPAGGFAPFLSEWWTASLNDDGDLLLNSVFEQAPDDALWHREWSETNGELFIGSLIDPNDPNGELYSYTFDLTNRNGDDWPTILAEGSETLADGTNQPYWLVLTPQPVAALATTAVPEPSAVLLMSVSISAIIIVGRRVRPLVS